LQSGIGFGKLESYTKLDKLGEVSWHFWWFYCSRYI